MADYDFVNESSLKRFITEEMKLRSSNSAIEELSAALKGIITEVLKISAESASNDKRTTIMNRDIKKGLAKGVQKEDLDNEEILNQLLKESPADLGKIAKGITDYIERKKAA